MAYTPTEWATGDVITAEKLNNMEQGIEDAQLNILTVDLDETFGTHDVYNIQISDIDGDVAAAMSNPEQTVIHIKFTDRDCVLHWDGRYSSASHHFTTAVEVGGSTGGVTIYIIEGHLSAGLFEFYLFPGFPVSGEYDKMLLTSRAGYPSQWQCGYKKNSGTLAVASDFSSATFTSTYVPTGTETYDIISDYIDATITIGGAPMGKMRLQSVAVGGVAYGGVMYNPLSSVNLAVGITYDTTNSAWAAKVSVLS